VENFAHNLCCQIWADDNSSTCTFLMEKSVTFTGARANENIPSINRWFVYKAIEGRHVRIRYRKSVKTWRRYAWHSHKVILIILFTLGILVYIKYWKTKYKWHKAKQFALLNTWALQNKFSSLRSAKVNVKHQSINQSISSLGLMLKTE